MRRIILISSIILMLTIFIGNLMTNYPKVNMPFCPSPLCEDL